MPALACRKYLLQKSGVSKHIRDMLIGYARILTDDHDLRLQRADAVWKLVFLADFDVAAGISTEGRITYD